MPAACAWSPERRPAVDRSSRLTFNGFGDGIREGGRLVSHVRSGGCAGFLRVTSRWAARRYAETHIRRGPLIVRIIRGVLHGES